jgi:2-polyprenyl-6-methoxyphenol hydroxylase-like FAD-dependent oxidoreductase
MERPHGGVARQWFAAQQVMAWLPLGAAGDERRLMSIVWSLPEGRATDMMALDSDAFAQKVAEAGQHSLGALTLISRRDAVPLVRMEARDWCADAIALVGDAAHAVHPLAGQGLNLGIADAATLAQTVGARGALARAGDRAVLRRYARARREAAALMVNSTDGLFGLFAREDDVSKLVRRRGMAWFGKQSWLKELAVGYASKS